MSASASTLTAPDLHVGQALQIRWQGDRWLPATVYRVYEMGADVTVGSRGVHYVQAIDMRLPR